jgi:hypothetical protein
MIQLRRVQKLLQHGHHRSGVRLLESGVLCTQANQEVGRQKGAHSPIPWLAQGRRLVHSRREAPNPQGTNLDEGPRLSKLWNHEMGRPTCSEDAITLSTTGTHASAADFDLLEAMVLHRVVAIAGAATWAEINGYFYHDKELCD